MEDILIVSAKDSEPANLWAQYFASYFEQISQNANRKPYRIRHVGIEEIIANNGDVRHIAERTTCVKLQLIIICPLLLEKIQDHPQYAANGLPKLLLPDRILALQLGTTDDDITDTHKEALPSFQQWQRRPVGQDQDQNFALEFVSTAIGIFTKIWKQQSSIASEENSQFSIAPKKIRYGQTSVLILLEYPLQHEDIIKINIVKNEEMTEIKNVKRRNPYTLKFTIPEKFLEVSAIVNILVEKNGSFIGKRPIKCESRLRELEQILRSTNNPIEFMCQSLGFSPHDTEQLDNWLVHMFQKNVPPNFALFVNDSLGGNKHVCELFPTLLHFAARFGLSKLTAQLLDCPGGDLACEIRNVQDFTPADIAENVGHKEINNMLRGYMKMNELAVVYTKIKKLTTDKHVQEIMLGSSEDPEEHYLIPKKPQKLVIEEFYKMCPAPKPFFSKSAPSTPVTEEEHSLTQYIAMDQRKLQSHQDQNYQNFPMLPEPISSTVTNQAGSSKDLVVPEVSLFHLLQEQKKKQRHHSSMQSILSKNSKSSMNEDKVQVELAEIINDFKNNVHTIAQTEQLVAEWQNRNDVQKSFKEKQEQLKEMRDRYDKIQRDLKHGGKKSSAFERFKKIFAWSPHSQHYHISNQNCIKEEMEFKTDGQARPISSLSLQSTASSSSSGRMSTISGCSLGDSGTHSDHEERKTVLSTSTEEDYNSSSSFNNYLIPPTPRPVKTPLMMCQFPTIEERTGREHLDSFYIQFPPNGLPVNPGHSGHPGSIDEVDHNNPSGKKEPFEEDQQTEQEPLIQQQEYMNLPLGYLSIEHQQHDYMNFKTVSS